MPAFSNISGDYAGTMQDAQGGSGTATATFAQHSGGVAGGAITDTEAAAKITAQISLAFTSAATMSGSMVVDYASGTTCTFSTTASYNTSTNVLSGSYAAITNCSGDSGTYTLTQQCIDTITSSERRIMILPAPC